MALREKGHLRPELAVVSGDVTSVEKDGDVVPLTAVGPVAARVKARFKLRKGLGGDARLKPVLPAPKAQLEFDKVGVGIHVLDGLPRRLHQIHHVSKGMLGAWQLV